MKEEIKDKKKLPELKKLVLARLDVMPPNFKLSVGSEGTFKKEELMEHVEKEDTIGLQVINMQLRFIKALTSGKLIETLNE